MRALLASVGRGAGWKLVSDLLGRVLQYALLMLAARSLDLAGFGDFTFALSVGYMLSQVADFGLQLYLQRELARLAIPAPAPLLHHESAAARLVCVGLVSKRAVAVSFAICCWFCGSRLATTSGAAVGLSRSRYQRSTLLIASGRCAGSDEAIAYLTGRSITSFLAWPYLLGAERWGLRLLPRCRACGYIYSYSRFLAYVRRYRLTGATGGARWAAQARPGHRVRKFAFRVDNLLIRAIGGRASSETLSIYTAPTNSADLIVPAWCCRYLSLHPAGAQLPIPALAWRFAAGAWQTDPLLGRDAGLAPGWWARGR